MVAGCVSVNVFQRQAPRYLRGEKLLIPRSVLDLLFDVLMRRNTESWALYLHALWWEGRS